LVLLLGCFGWLDLVDVDGFLRFDGSAASSAAPAWTNRRAATDFGTCQCKIRLPATVGVDEMLETDLLAEPLLDAREAAKLVRSRELPHVKVGRGLRFTRADLAAWVAENSYGRRARR
jgi:hypothetical protein